MRVTLSGIVTVDKLAHESKTELLILDTLSGMATVDTLEQYAKAASPILITLSGIVMLVKRKQE